MTLPSWNLNQFYESIEDNQINKDFKKHVFINPTIIDKSENISSFNEGCLSIPDIRGDVKRPDSIKIKFYDQE